MAADFINISEAIKVLASGTKKTQEHLNYFSSTFLLDSVTKRVKKKKKEPKYIHLLSKENIVFVLHLTWRAFCRLLEPCFAILLMYVYFSVHFRKSQVNERSSIQFKGRFHASLYSV